MKQLLVLLGLLVLSTEAWNPKTRYFYWNVARDVQVIEGRTLIVNTINGRIKGPAIFAKQGDFLSVKITNNLPDAGLSIHWHGMEMRDYQLYDGPVGLVQCSLAPGESMTYKFKVQEHPGTYWYHTHAEMFPSGHDMVRGPIVVLPEDGPVYPSHLIDNYDYTHLNERVLFYQDFYPNYIAHDYLMGLGDLRELGGFNAEGGIALTAPWSGGCLNGGEEKGFMQFENGEYRFRLANGGSTTPMLWSIDGYSFKVVAADGTDVEPYEVDQIQIHLGERYDVLVNFNVDAPQNVWMRGAATAVTNPAAVILTTLQLRPDNSFEYLEGPATSSPNPDPVLMNCNYFGEQEKCVSVTALKSKADEFKTRPLLDDTELHTADFFFSLPPVYGYFFSLDGGTYTQNALPHHPIAYPDFDNEKDMNPHTNVLNLALDKTVTIVLRNGAGIAHPIHLHGHKFEVLEEISRAKPNCFGGQCPLPDLETGFSAPISELAKRETRGVLKDVIIVPMFGAAVVRFNTDNPGVWFAHCHFDEHVDSGQGFVMNEGNWKAAKVPADFPSCDYTGRLQHMTSELCTCDPEELDPTWLCSKDYMCQWTRRRSFGH
ncbi:uncharacterized protein LOC134815986 [Bolinopsis microptera]|uniref:uncharacterized protein LOC134815986 n=1 Tax=Bolinopsis microptera TaxID=2820187 RepID=UPI003078EB99